MKKNLLSILLISSGLMAFGQNNRQATATTSHSQLSSSNPAARQIHSPMQVQAPPGACDTLNYPIPAGWVLTNYIATNVNPGDDGFVNGPNAYGDLEKAMYFDASAQSFTKMIGCFIAFDNAYTSNPALIVPVKVYDGTSGTPGTLLATQNLTMAQIMANVNALFYTDVIFSTPVTLPASKKFFVSVDVSNLTWTGAPGTDSLSINSNQNGQTNPGMAWEKWSDNTWHNMNTPSASGGWNINISTVILPYLTSTLRTPVSFTENLTTVCQGGTINFNGTASMPFNNCVWDFGTGNTPAPAGTVGQSTITATFNTTGANVVKLYTSSGGCDQIDSAQVTITVNALPTVGHTPASPAFCPGGNVSVNATGANTYTWSPGTGLSATTGSVVVANPASTATYTITGTGANGCTNTNVVTVTMNTAPTVGANATSTTICSGSAVTLTGSGAATYTWTGGATDGVAFNPTSTNTYSVTGTAANGCTGTANVTVNVNNLPTVTANSSATGAVCPGTGVTLTGGGATTYTWTGGVSDGVSFVPSSTATYTVTGTDVNNCTNTANVTVTVNTVVTPTITVAGNDLTSTSAVSYQWLMNGAPIGGATSQMYSITADGNYSVITTDANGCSDTSAVQSMTFVGLKSASANASIKVYPNPTKGAFNVSVSLDKNMGYTIELRNVIGQNLFTETVSNTSEFKKSFDMSEKAGLYFVVIKDEAGKSSVHKVVVE